MEFILGTLVGATGVLAFSRRAQRHQRLGEDAEHAAVATGEPWKHRPDRDLDLARLLHAMYGMARYGIENFLRKHSPEAVALLSQQFEDIAAAIRSVRCGTVQRNTFLSKRWNLRPSLKSLDLERILQPALYAALQGLKSSNVTAARRALRDLLQERVHRVYSFPMLREDFCEILRLESCRFMDFLNEYDEELHPGGLELRRKSAVLTSMGLESLENILLREVVQPISEMLYSDVGGAELDFKFGYVLGYAQTGHAMGRSQIERDRLGVHTDDSEVTLNVCLGVPGFLGGELAFNGLRSSPTEGVRQGIVPHMIGQAVVHLGQQLHQVLKVESGERHVLIMWCRSSDFRKYHCPCCLKNRSVPEGENGCVCGPIWRSYYK